MEENSSNVSLENSQVRPKTPPMLPAIKNTSKHYQGVMIKRMVNKAERSLDLQRSKISDRSKLVT